MHTPVSKNTVKQVLQENGIDNPGKASIREIVKVVNDIQKASGIKFIRMEMGVPGLEPAKIGIEAEIQALQSGVASKYPMIEGIPEFKKEASRFARLFMDITVQPESCIATVGAMQGAMATFMVVSRLNDKKKKTLFLDPGFPVQKQQHRVLNIPYATFDIYNFRGEKLREKLESYLSSGEFSSLIYSNPNNPSWVCFTEAELQIIGDLSTKYDVVAIEDLAYFAMDFRTDKSVPGVPPYQPTVAKYTQNYVLLISASKAFSYAGQRIGMVIINDQLAGREYPKLKEVYPSAYFGRAFIYGALYPLSAGTSHSAQKGVAAMLKAANDGEFNFVEEVKPYQKRASIMKELFTKNGFTIVYDKDMEKSIADGFYFTISYRGFTGAELLKALLLYGISAISLEITGSERTEGLRACVSQITEDQMPLLKERLEIFCKQHPLN